MKINEVKLPSGIGLIGISRCPGAVPLRRATGDPGTSLGDDLRDVIAWGGTGLLCLMHQSELDALGASDLIEVAAEMGISALRVPILDCHPPDERFLERWSEIEALVVPRLLANQRVLVHCAAGQGRSPMVAVMLLVSLYGLPVHQAIAKVGVAHPNAIGARTREQEDFLGGWSATLPLRPTASHK